MAIHVPLSLVAQAESHLLMFSHINLSSPAIWDPISVLTQDMLMGLYVLTSGNCRGICINRYSPGNRIKYQTKKSDNNSYEYTKEPFFFCNSYDAIGAYRKKRINLDSPLWLQWQLDQRVIASRETPIEVHYESLVIYYEIYEHYLIVKSIQKRLFFYTFKLLLVIFLFIEKLNKPYMGFLMPVPTVLPN